ncbi:MAG: tetratricopeptide repeat protein [Mycobacteriales bacterium]
MRSHRLDRWGVPVDSAGDEAVGLLDEAVADLVAFGSSAMTLVGRALDADPELVLGHCLTAYLHMFAYTRDGVGRARRCVDRARELVEHGRGGAREAAHLRAAQCWSAGDITGATRVWERHLASTPTDLLATRITQDAYYFLGDARNLRDSPARVLRAWSDELPMASFVRSMYAFGLEECGDYPAAETVARAGVAAAPADVWGHHCVAHVLEMQGRTGEGDAYMRASCPHWEHSGFPKHMWWHWGLFHLERGDLDAAVRVYDEGLHFDSTSAVLELVDAAGLLWRLYLYGVDLGDRPEALADAFEPHAEDAVYAFNDIHTVMGLAMAGRDDAARRVISAMAKHSEGDNRRMCDASGVTAATGLLAFARGDYPDALDALNESRYTAVVFGGSNAQRDVLHLSTIAAAAGAGDRGMIDAMRAERVALKPPAAAAIDRLVDANGPIRTSARSAPGSASSM